jgi:hypothetical protein
MLLYDACTMELISGDRAVMRLEMEHSSEQWLRIVKACLTLADRTKCEFAGAWVLEEAKKEGITWFPNLRPLVTCGILERTSGSRGGRRAYYVMLDPEGVRNALRERGL